MSFGEKTSNKKAANSNPVNEIQYPVKANSENNFLNFSNPNQDPGNNNMKMEWIIMPYAYDPEKQVIEVFDPVFGLTNLEDFKYEL